MAPMADSDPAAACHPSQEGVDACPHHEQMQSDAVIAHAILGLPSLILATSPDADGAAASGVLYAPGAPANTAPGPSLAPLRL